MRKQTITPIAIQGVELGLLPPPPPPPPTPSSPPLPDPLRLKRASAFVGVEGDGSPDGVEVGGSELGGMAFVFGYVLGVGISFRTLIAMISEFPPLEMHH
jgi:hypothetical protein